MMNSVGSLQLMCLAFFMRNKLVAYFLLLVLVPLLNLGPSLHRLTCFGLHGDGCCNIVESAASPCCCDRHRSHSTSTNELQLTLDSSHSGHSDCPLCRFFASCNMVQLQADHIFVDSRCCEVAFLVPNIRVCELIPAHSRGPPTLSFCSFC
jgi:hypothetical protein